MKPSRPLKRRPFFKYILLVTLLGAAIYTFSGKDSRNTAHPLVILHDDDVSTTRSRKNEQNPRPTISTKAISSSSESSLSKKAAAGVNVDLDIGDDGDVAAERYDKSEPWSSKMGVDDDESVDLEEDATDGAAFSGEGLDDGDENENTDEDHDEDITLTMGQKYDVNVRSGSDPDGLVDMVFGHAQDENVTKVLDWMADCRNISCIIKANDRLQGRTRFNLPHFFLVGWQKSATTSVNAYLRHHPQYLPGIKKEPHWFSVCQHNLNAPHCLPQTEEEYLKDFLKLDEAVASRLEMVTLDASADYAGKGGAMARKLYRLFPWLKIVIMVREPISRLISYTRMHTQSTFQEWKACRPGSSLYTCLLPHLTPGAVNSNYSEALQGWLTTFPTEQIHVIQFEELQEDPEKVLYNLKDFLGMRVDLPDRTISNVNSRREGDGYPMGRGQYLKLVRLIKDDAYNTADLLHQYGLADKTAWIARWSAVWNGFLDSCPDFEGECHIDSN